MRILKVFFQVSGRNITYTNYLMISWHIIISVRGIADLHRMQECTVNYSWSKDLKEFTFLITSDLRIVKNLILTSLCMENSCFWHHLFLQYCHHTYYSYSIYFFAVITACQKKLWEGNVFSDVCLSVCLSTGGPMWPLVMMHWTWPYRDPLSLAPALFSLYMELHGLVSDPPSQALLLVTSGD